MDLERTSQVWGICGNLGGGKTLTAVEVACRAMACGFYVVTNIQIDVDAVARDFGTHVLKLYRSVDLERDNPNDWPTGDPRGSGGKRRVLVILDEVSEWFDQYAGTSTQVRTFLSWLRHSSKRSQDVFLVTQRREYLAKSLRILVARWVWVEDLAVWRLPKIGIRVPFCGGFVARVVRDRVGNEVQRVELSRKRRWGAYYCTAQLLNNSLATPYEIPAIKQRPKHDALNWSLWIAAVISWVMWVGQ